MKRFPRLGMRPIARSIRRWWALQPRTWRRGLVMSYPHYLHLHDQLRPDVSVYYNIDDYALYWPRAAETDPRAGAGDGPRGRCDCLCLPGACRRAAGPRCRKRPAESITCPHGAPTPFLAPKPLCRPAEPPADMAHLPRPYLGFIGSLEDRLDWELMDRISRTFAEASIIVVGRVADRSTSPGGTQCSRFLSRPNVHALGWRAQEALAAYYQAFDVTLIPYRMDHPFNRACNPTKIMDAMGSGRPIVATAIPECRLHAERFDVAENGDEFIEAVRKILGQPVRRRPGRVAACVCSGQYVPRCQRAYPGFDRAQSPGMGRKATRWPGSPVSACAKP